MKFIRAFIRALHAERTRARRKWLYKSRVVSSSPKFDPRSSIEMHKRIIGDPTTPAMLRRQAF